MRSYSKQDFYSFQASATALGGQLHAPFSKAIAPLAPVVLAPAGGFASARSGAFNLDEIVSVSSAYTLVTGRECKEEGTHATLVTAVVEDLNILQVVTAKRIVAQISVSRPIDGGPHRITLAGTQFEGLLLAGQAAHPRLNAGFLNPSAASGDRGSPVGWPSFRDAVSDQAQKLLDSFKNHPNTEAATWAKNRHGWGYAESAPSGGGLYSLVDGFEEEDLPGAYGHIVEIPGFGRVHFGELFVTKHAVQYVSVRADLGCPVAGTVTGPVAEEAGGTGVGNRD